MYKATVLAGIVLFGVLSLVAGEVTVTFLGHSCFTLATEDGVVMLDPYATYLPYPALPKPA
ncbi:MBL fold metallo-hydrolase, partial [Candidatus Bipolaricaulota bacterium]|nr:MBL fold metallo-hydrolase [Candidatus Bipolaricaulota bacterium]